MNDFVARDPRLHVKTHFNLQSPFNYDNAVFRDIVIGATGVPCPLVVDQTEGGR